MSSLKRTPSKSGSACGETSRKNKVMKADNIDAEFIPLIWKILRDVVREPKDQGQRVKQCRSLGQNMEELQKKLHLVRKQIQNLPGINSSKEEQKKNLQTVQKQLTQKKELILKYRAMIQ